MVKLQKGFNSQYSITAPKKYVEGFGWKKGDKIKFKLSGKQQLEMYKKV